MQKKILLKQPRKQKNSRHTEESKGWYSLITCSFLLFINSFHYLYLTVFKPRLFSSHSVYFVYLFLLALGGPSNWQLSVIFLNVGAIMVAMPDLNIVGRFNTHRSTYIFLQSLVHISHVNSNKCSSSTLTLPKLSLLQENLCPLT